jgi:N-methylhydantoinase A
MVEAHVFERDRLGSGEVATGPAVITEAETTTVVPVGFTARMRSDRTLELLREKNKGAAR